MRKIALRVSKAVIEDKALTSGTAVTSDSVHWKGNVGFASLNVIEDKSGGAGDVDIYAEYSIDGTNFSKSYESDLDGTISADGNIVTALGNTGDEGRNIVFDPRLFPYVRFVFDPDANSEITAVLVYQEED